MKKKKGYAKMAKWTETETLLFLYGWRQRVQEKGTVFESGVGRIGENLATLLPPRSHDEWDGDDSLKDNVTSDRLFVTVHV